MINVDIFFFINVDFFFDLRGVSGPAYAHHDYSPRPTGHPASSGAGKAQEHDDIFYMDSLM